jgi:A/G-specific adenine glycosylase
VPPRELTLEQAEVLADGVPRLRDLPWRRTRDPWAVLVSEVMLQQTQAARVAPRWEEFLGRWPDPASCAAAPLADVLDAWHGLGYPRRARNLWLAAARCVELHDGRLPETLDELLDLPGIGPYTARAVLAFAYEAEGAAVVDTNVARVLARRVGRRLTPRQAQAEADELVPDGRSWTWNQVLMDLGATRCRPVPDCTGCPVACDWSAAGRPDPDPAVGSAGVSRGQAPYAGSDRQARGRLLAAIVGGASCDPADVLDGDPEWVSSIVRSLVDDGLATCADDGILHRP